MDESSGKVHKMQTHPTSNVVIDIAAFKVSHVTVMDIDATALQDCESEVKLHRGTG